MLNITIIFGQWVLSFSLQAQDNISEWLRKMCLGALLNHKIESDALMLS